MKRPTNITIPELAELASLDAFGLLDAEDALHFEDSFLAAPEQVRETIRNLQAELVSDESLLGSEEPDEALRAKVLERVARAMSEQDVLLQPLAAIGRAGVAPRAEMATPTSFTQSIWTWRAAALVLLGVSITLAIFGIISDSKNHLLIQAINNRQAQFVLNQPPGDAEQIAWPTDDGQYRVVLLADMTGSAGRARLFLNHQDGSNPRIAYDLDRRLADLTIYAIDDEGHFGPKGETYVVAHLDPTQNSTTVVDGFNAEWIGKTRMVARDNSGRDILVQI
ncbi:MAG: hypothetical protein MK116_02680 [Phycisphaerales bacterium]|nr:hypothetical protein [Phycisphaerales bacterium]